MKKHFMMMLVLSFSFYNSYSQLIDSFSDGNLNLNPSWSGDTNQFIVNSNYELQLNSNGADSSSISTINSLNFNDSLEWNFTIRMSFSPSSQNYCRVYLVSDASNLEQSLNGYYLQFGESGSADAISLWQQNGFSSIQILRGTDGTISNSFFVHVKVLRKTNGDWFLYTDYSSGSNFILEASANDLSIITTSTFGFKCVYTSSNASKFYFDNIYVGREIIDTVKPKTISCYASDTNQIQLLFSEAVITSSVNNVSHYILRPGANPAISAIQDSLNPAFVKITFDSSFVSGVKYTLYTLSITDLNGNINYLDSIKFEYVKLDTAIFGDLIITEIMCDPVSAPSLPEAEYLEIYNRSNKYITTNGLKIKDASTIAYLPIDTLHPYTFYVYCSSANAALLAQQQITNIRGLSTFPTLNNDGDQIELRNDFSKLDQAYYDAGWYHNTQKESGGWSIERIDANFLCNNGDNWQASNDARGGSPGSENSVAGIFWDDRAPSLIHINLIDSSTIVLHFDESMDQKQLMDETNYFVEGKSMSGTTFSIDENDEKNVIVSLPWFIQKGIIYSLQLNEKIKDCAGNNISENRAAKFGISSMLNSNSLIINEILFNPIADGKDFLEIYNPTNEIYNLKDLIIANADVITLQMETQVEVSKSDRLIFPGDYIALTESAENISSNYRVFDSRKIIQTDLPSFNDDEGIAILADKSLVELDRFQYNEKMHFSLLNENEGISLERISSSIPTAMNSNWHSASSASGYATPGAKNSQDYSQEENPFEFWMEPLLFSPDNDGYHDVLAINIATDKPGFFGSVKVYNEEGALIKSLLKQELLGTKSLLIWDGTNEETVKMPIGIYVIWAELTNPDGTIIHHKKACVLAHKN